MTTTVTAGNTASFQIGPFDTITLSSANGVGRLALTSQAPKLVADQALSLQNGTFGPWGAPMSVVMTVSQGSVGYDVNAMSLTVDQTVTAQALVSNAGNGASLVKSAGYHFHGWAPNQQKDLKWWDYSGSLNDGAFQANLTSTIAYANAGMITQANPTAVGELSLIAIPAVSWNWASGDNLFLFWRGMATPEGADAPIMGDTSGTAANGFRVVVSSAGKLKVNAYQASGTLSRFGGTSTSTVFEAAVEHSFAFCISGAGTICYWSDGVRDATYASGFLALSGGGAVDTSNSSTLKIGGDGGTSGSIQGGVACQHRALVILKGRSSSGAPAVADLDTLVAALHRNPQALVSSASW